MTLRDRRKAMGITQEAAAELLGVGLRHYQKLEAGHAVVTRTIEKLAALVMREAAPA